jgi:hypothetical protein
MCPSAKFADGQLLNYTASFVSLLQFHTVYRLLSSRDQDAPSLAGPKGSLCALSQTSTSSGRPELAYEICRGSF